MPSSLGSSTLLGKFDPEDKGTNNPSKLLTQPSATSQRTWIFSNTTVRTCKLSQYILDIFNEICNFCGCAAMVWSSDKKCHTGLLDSYTWSQSKAWSPPKNNSPYNCLMWSLFNLFTTYLKPVVQLEMTHLYASNLNSRQFHIFKRRRQEKNFTLHSGKYSNMAFKLHFWNMTPCHLVDMYKHFGRTCCLHFQSRRY
jgi:hypothetical protein